MVIDQFLCPRASLLFAHTVLEHHYLFAFIVSHNYLLLRLTSPAKGGVLMSVEINLK